MLSFFFFFFFSTWLENKFLFWRQGGPIGETKIVDKWWGTTEEGFHPIISIKVTLGDFFLPSLIIFFLQFSWVLLAIKPIFYPH